MSEHESETAQSHDAWPRTVDVAVVGAGVIGLAIAWSLARAGRAVCVIDPDPAGGATFAAAGMLAPVSEFHYREENLLELMLASAALYPAFLGALSEVGCSTGYRASETIVVGIDSADRQSLADLHDAQQRNGLLVEPITLREARSREPMLSPGVSCAYRVRHDHHLDPRLLAAGLLKALTSIAEQAGLPGGVVRQRAAGLIHAEVEDDDSMVVGVELVDGTRIMATEVVVANGLSAPGLVGLPPSLALSMRPVHGEILRLSVGERLHPLITSTVRGLVRGEPVYLVPRDDGTIVVGATQREDDSARVSAGGVYRLLRDAQEIVPAVAELDLIEVTARARPGTPDNAPLLGRVAMSGGAHVAGLVIATGFFRHGVLLAPIAAEICCGLIEGARDARWDAYRPDRFGHS
ncbi:glycine oxidase ThiO [Microcella alkalica]|uniref:glycine oxidase n=1 Tax=Microcella alkalica TaxID=355930 RepID=A0A839E4Y9_9MICO|nr:glycine oxidase [Microcella alkalica]